jgi:hypothetical protein
VSLTPPGPFTRGNTTTTLTVTDATGAKETCTSTIDVIDATPPTFDPTSPTVVQVVACQPTTNLVTLTAPTATDICNCLTMAGQVTAVNGSPASIPLTNVGGNTFQGTLPVGILTLQWVATNCDGVPSAPFTQTLQLLAAPVLYAQDELRIGDRATVQTSSGPNGAIDNSGSDDDDETSLGEGATTGSILSTPAVELDQSTVNGSVQSGSTVDNNGATVTGSVVQNSAPVLPPFPPLTVPSPFPTGSDVHAHHGQTIALAPGAYGDLHPSNGGTLALSAGTYFVDSLRVTPGGTLSIDASGGTVTVLVNERIEYAGSVVSNGQPNQFVLGYVGSRDVTLGADFSGVVIAPSAALDLANDRGSYAGAFYAHTIRVAERATVLESPYACK